MSKPFHFSPTQQLNAFAEKFKAMAISMPENTSVYSMHTATQPFAHLFMDNIMTEYRRSKFYKPMFHKKLIYTFQVDGCTLLILS